MPAALRPAAPPSDALAPDRPGLPLAPDRPGLPLAPDAAPPAAALGTLDLVWLAVLGAARQRAAGVAYIGARVAVASDDVWSAGVERLDGAVGELRPDFASPVPRFHLTPHGRETLALLLAGPAAAGPHGLGPAARRLKRALTCPAPWGAALA